MLKRLEYVQSFCDPSELIRALISLVCDLISLSVFQSSLFFYGNPIVSKDFGGFGRCAELDLNNCIELLFCGKENR